MTLKVLHSPSGQDVEAMNAMPLKAPGGCIIVNLYLMQHCVVTCAVSCAGP